MTWYALLVLAVAVERLIEVRVAERNRAVSKTHGGVELGAGHYPAMVALHFSLLVGCLVDPGLSVEHSRHRHSGCEPRHRRPLPADPSSELRRGNRRRCGAAVGALGMGYRASFLDPQRMVAEHPGQGRKRRTGEPEMIDLLVVGGGPAGLATAIHGGRGCTWLSPNAAADRSTRRAVKA
jgi:hypothetical protein